MLRSCVSLTLRLFQFEMLTSEGDVLDCVVGDEEVRAQGRLLPRQCQRAFFAVVYSLLAEPPTGLPGHSTLRPQPSKVISAPSPIAAGCLPSSGTDAGSEGRGSPGT